MLGRQALGQVGTEAVGQGEDKQRRAVSVLLERREGARKKIFFGGLFFEAL